MFKKCIFYREVDFNIKIEYYNINICVVKYRVRYILIYKWEQYLYCNLTSDSSSSFTIRTNLTKIKLYFRDSIMFAEHIVHIEILDMQQCKIYKD